MAENGGLPIESATKINPYGASDEQLQRYRDALDEGIAALQKRYESPNWFKVAAGFAKPQLGGFIASLGSASEALGENVEQQRSQQLPIAQMKAQLSQADILMSQNKKVASMIADRRAKGLPITPEFVAEIVNIAPDSATAKSLQSQLATNQKQQEITASVQSNALKAIEAAQNLGVEINPNLYTQAGLKPPAMMGGNNPPATPGALGNERLPTDATVPAVQLPTGNTVPGASAVEGNDKTASSATGQIKKLPNEARVNENQYKLYEMGIPIISGMRTQVEQNALKDHKDAQGKWLTKEGLPVADVSKHLYGQAIDVDPNQMTDEHRNKLKDFGYVQPMPKEDPGHWVLAVAPKPNKPAERQFIASGNQGGFNPLYTMKDAASLRNLSDEELNKQANARFGSLEAVANPKSYNENKNALDSMIATIMSDPKTANRVTNPLAQKGGIWGGALNAAEAGIGFSLNGLTGSLHLPIANAIIGSYDRDSRNYFDTLNTQSARVAQIQQQLSNVNPSSIRAGEVELYKNASVNPRTQFPNVMLYNLHYSKLNNEMLHEMYDRANKIRTNQDPDYALHPTSRTQMLDIMTSPAMTEIADKYIKKFDKLNEEFLSKIQPKKKYAPLNIEINGSSKKK